MFLSPQTLRIATENGTQEVEIAIFKINRKYPMSKVSAANKPSA